MEEDWVEEWLAQEKKEHPAMAWVYRRIEFDHLIYEQERIIMDSAHPDGRTNASRRHPDLPLDTASGIYLKNFLRLGKEGGTRLLPVPEDSPHGVHTSTPGRHYFSRRDGLDGNGWCGPVRDDPKAHMLADIDSWRRNRSVYLAEKERGRKIQYHFCDDLPWPVSKDSDVPAFRNIAYVRQRYPSWDAEKMSRLEKALAIRACHADIDIELRTLTEKEYLFWEKFDVSTY